MQDYQNRVIEEQVELSGKIYKLLEFMYNDEYSSLPAVEQGLLMVQLNAMEQYEKTLKRRIDLFSF